MPNCVPIILQVVKKILLFLLFSGAALAGILLWFFFARGDALSEKNLTFATIQQGTMVDVVSATGIVEAPEILVVNADMPGVIKAIRARVNEIVMEGEILATLEDNRILLKVEEAANGVGMAKAGLAQAEAAREASLIGLKTQIDLESKGGFRSEREQAQAQAKAADAGVQAAEARLRAAETSLKEAKLALNQTFIKVPDRSGSAHSKREFLVLERKAVVGQTVGPQGTPLFTLAPDLAHMEIHAQIGEGDNNKIKAGLTAVFTLNGYNDEVLEFEGTLKEVRPLGVNIKGAVYYPAIIDVRNRKDPNTSQWQLRPGMTVSVDIVRYEHKNVWKVPSAALNFTLEDAYLTDAARAHLAEWKARPDYDQWRAVWTWDATERKPWPLWIRIGGLKNGAAGLKDSEGNEILEWEPGREPTTAHPPPRVIIAAPPARSPGFFNQPVPIKVS
jgi:multidrug efflux pump subunit AcrA (membrane-fusion protein)